ncbi:hypothetical protein YC2023_083776 [Brassica napus]
MSVLCPSYPSFNSNIIFSTRGFLTRLFPSSTCITKRRSRRLEKSRLTRSVCGESFLIFPDPHTSHLYCNGGISLLHKNHSSPLKKHLNFSDPQGNESGRWRGCVVFVGEEKLNSTIDSINSSRLPELIQKSWESQKVSLSVINSKKFSYERRNVKKEQNWGYKRQSTQIKYVSSNMCLIV